MKKNLLIAALLCAPVAHTAFGKCKGGVCRPKARKVVKVKRNPVRSCVNGVCSLPAKATKAAVKTVKRTVKAITPSCRSCKK